MSYTCVSYRRFVPRFVLAVMVLGTSARVMAEPVILRSGLAPVTIQIASELQTSIDAMLLASPTFRQQYERIVAAPRLSLCAHMTQRPYRARPFIRRYDSGLIVVNIEIGPGRHQAEWIAHEFEHVIEQLDGLSLWRLASRGQAGAWFSGGQMIERDRAQRTGRVVLDEIAGRRSAQTSLWTKQTQ